ncbi:MAG: hypothetical protein ACP5QK_03330 [Myxococcota bacterium]
MIPHITVLIIAEKLGRWWIGSLIYPGLRLQVIRKRLLDIYNPKDLMEEEE